MNDVTGDINDTKTKGNRSKYPNVFVLARIRDKLCFSIYSLGRTSRLVE